MLENLRGIAAHERAGFRRFLNQTERFLGEKLHGRKPHIFATANGQRAIPISDAFFDNLYSVEFALLDFGSAATIHIQTTHRTPVEITVANFHQHLEDIAFTPDIAIHFITEEPFETIPRVTQALTAAKNAYPNMLHLVVNLLPFHSRDQESHRKKGWSLEKLTEDLDMMYLGLDPRFAPENRGQKREDSTHPVFTEEKFLSLLATFFQSKSAVEYLQLLKNQSRVIGASMGEEEFVLAKSPHLLGSNGERQIYSLEKAIAQSLSEEGRITTAKRSKLDYPLRDIFILQFPPTPGLPNLNDLVNLLPKKYPDVRRAFFFAQTSPALLSERTHGLQYGNITSLDLFPAA